MWLHGKAKQQRKQNGETIINSAPCMRVNKLDA